MSSTNGAGRFAGQVAIVTGASREPSIGRSTAWQLAAQGAALVLNGRDEDVLAETARAFEQAGFDVCAVAGAVQDDPTPQRLVDAAVARFGGVDLLVNTVGGSPFKGSPGELDRATLLGTIELNTWGTLALIQRAVEAGLAEGGGAVVNISSGTVHKTTPNMLAYAAAKSALNAMTRTLARDLGPRGVRVNGVAPGLTQTDGTRAMWEPDAGRAAGANLLLGRLTQAEDIANACVFLLSDDARQITGQILDVDGGNHLMGGGWTPITDAEMQAREKRGD